jgi:hypothetical protein
MHGRRTSDPCNGLPRILGYARHSDARGNGVMGSISVAGGVVTGGIAIAYRMDVAESLWLQFYAYAALFGIFGAVGAVGLFRGRWRISVILGVIVNGLGLCWKCGSLYVLILRCRAQGWM